MKKIKKILLLLPLFAIIGLSGCIENTPTGPVFNIFQQTTTIPKTNYVTIATDKPQYIPGEIAITSITSDQKNANCNIFITVGMTTSSLTSVQLDNSGSFKSSMTIPSSPGTYLVHTVCNGIKSNIVTVVISSQPITTVLTTISTTIPTTVVTTTVLG